MDDNAIGFLLGVFLSLFGFVTILFGLGLVVFTIHKVQKGGSGFTIILYAIETVIPFGIVCALVWLIGNNSYNPIALWSGACLMGAINMFFLFRKTPQGTPTVMALWNSIKAELAGGNVGDGQKIH